MAVVLGTNAGFVTVAPTSDPDTVSSFRIDNLLTAIKDTSPAGAEKIIEIGWYAKTTSDESNFEVGLYSHDSGADEPENLLSGSSATNAKGTTTGWKVSTGLNIPISAETTYWVAVQLDDTLTESTSTRINRSTLVTGAKYAEDSDSSTLNDPFITSFSLNESVTAIYALIESAPAGFTRKIKIAGTFQDKPIKEKKAGTFQDKPISIKVGGTFQDA